DVFSTADGVLWTEATPNAGFSPRGGHASTVQGQRMFVFGGEGAGNIYSSEVWSSSNGATWKQVIPTPPSFSARAGHTSVSFLNYLFLIGGHDSSAVSAEVWHSP
ncbi:MAG: kelch repeat-containing protein, partial [candidate division FCPU426 bacterium]